MAKKQRFLTVGGSGQAPVPSAMPAVSFAQAVEDTVLFTELKQLWECASRERIRRSVQADREEYCLKVLQAKPGAKFVVREGQFRKKTVRLVDTYWRGPGRKRRLAAIVRLPKAMARLRGVSTEVVVWADELEPIQEVIARRLGA